MNSSPRLQIEIRVSPGTRFDNLDRVRQLLAFAVEHEARHGEVGIWLCSDDEIADLHKRYMDIDGPTDVISFSGDDGYLGDIAVSVDTAELQAHEAGHSTLREVGYLALHGLMHLFGYDDIEAEDRARMIARQDALITAFDRERPGDWS